MSDEVREFWIEDHPNDYTYRVYDKKPEPNRESDREYLFHVIEIKAFDELKAKVDGLQSKVNSLTEALQQIANQRPHAEAALEMKNIARKAIGK